MQKNDVGREWRAVPLAAIEDLPHGGKRLLVGQMPPSARDSLLQKDRPGALLLKVRVVVAFDGQHIEVDKAIDQFRRHPAQVGGVSSPAAMAFDHKSVRSGAIVRQRDRVHAKPIHRLEHVIESEYGVFESIAERLNQISNSI
jgi:hypothetical protein